MPPPQKIVGLRLCWFDVSLVSRGQIRNFRPLGSFFLVEVEFLVVGAPSEEQMVKKCADQKSCQTQLLVELGCVVVELGF